MLCALLALSGEEGLGELGGLSLEKLKVRMRRAHSHSLPQTPDRREQPGAVGLCSQGTRGDGLRLHSGCRVSLGAGEMSAWNGCSGTGTGCPGGRPSSVPGIAHNHVGMVRGGLGSAG